MCRGVGDLKVKIYSFYSVYLRSNPALVYISLAKYLNETKKEPGLLVNIFSEFNNI